MGACYDVTLKIKVTDEKNAIIALNKKIRNDKRVNFSLENYAKQGITTKTFDDLMKIFLAGWKNQEIKIDKSSHYTIYSNAFNASYGWEDVMIEMFKTLAPFLQNNSRFLIYSEDGYDELIVKNGKCIQLQ